MSREGERKEGGVSSSIFSSRKGRDIAISTDTGEPAVQVKNAEERGKTSTPQKGNALSLIRNRVRLKRRGESFSLLVKTTARGASSLSSFQRKRHPGVGLVSGAVQEICSQILKEKCRLR